MTQALTTVAETDPTYLTTHQKAQTLRALAMVIDRTEELLGRVMLTAHDVAEADGSRDIAAWLAHNTHRHTTHSRQRLALARTLDQRPALHHAARDGQLTRDQAHQIAHALTALHPQPGQTGPTNEITEQQAVDADTIDQAEAHLIAQAGDFGPRHLRAMGRRVLDVVAPDLAEAREGRLLAAEEARAAQRTFLRTHRNGDGTTDLRIRVADTTATRLLTYLHAYTSPRHPTQPGSQPGQHRNTQPYAQRLGHAFTSLLEGIDPTRLPRHGGDATTVIITITLDQLRTELGHATLAGDEPITAGHARRLACTARLIPAVLGADSEVLDLGRARRLYTPAQRKALTLTQPTCRAEGCDIPAAWCEAHHAGTPWAAGGTTDLTHHNHAVLLCAHHHHRAHDHRYTTTSPAGRLRFTRRT